MLILLGMKNLELKNKVYQMFVLSPCGDELSEGSELDIALRNGLGGVIFFTKNITSTAQIKKLVEDIKKTAIMPPFLGIDQEGGRVERTENIHGKKKYLSAQYAAEKGGEFLTRQTKEISEELKGYGLNVNFAPVLDVNTNEANPIIGERAFSNNAEKVINASKTVIETYVQNGIIPAGKHFPGHGMTSLDSHSEKPCCELSLEELETTHIAPFKAAIDDGIPMIMTSHVTYKAFDKDNTPASASKSIIKDYLRKTLNFKGIVVSDDMEMEGIKTDSPLETLIKSIKAGINMFLFRSSTPEILSLIESVYEASLNDPELRSDIESSFEKISQAKARFLM